MLKSLPLLSLLPLLLPLLPLSAIATFRGTTDSHSLTVEHRRAQHHPFTRWQQEEDQQEEIYQSYAEISFDAEEEQVRAWGATLGLEEDAVRSSITVEVFSPSGHSIGKEALTAISVGFLGFVLPEGTVAQRVVIHGSAFHLSAIVGAQSTAVHGKLVRYAIHS